MNRDLVLRIEGSLLERLLQRALKRGARFGQVKRSGARVIFVSTDARSAEILLSLCKKYAYDCQIVRRGGRAAFADTLKRRWTLAPGILLCVLLCLLALSRIWMVEIAFTGPSAALGQRSAMLAALNAAGIRPGMAASAVDSGLLQSRLMAEAGNYSFVGVRRQGVRLLVEASPEVPAPELYDIRHARDLVAARDGVVQEITVHSGEACVKAGDTVRRGQTLIRGEEAKTKEETAPVSALGTVVARCWAEGEAEGARTQPVRQRTGKTQTSARLKLLRFSLPMLECDGYPSEETEVEILPVVGLFLPLEIERVHHYETVESWEEMDCEALKSRLTALAAADARRKIAEMGVEMQDFALWTEITEENNTLRARAVYEISTDIAISRDALTEEVY